MPKSKRSKKISLTRTKQKGVELKTELIDNVKEAVDKYARIFTFSVADMRNSKLKEVRAEWKHSRMFFGKNKIITRALGKSKEDEYKENLSKVSAGLVGQMGLLLTNMTKEEVIAWFNKYSEADFARQGNIAPSTITVKAGPLPELSHSLEPQLRQWDMPTALQKGVIHLIKDFVICKRGEPITSDKASILRLFGYKMALFRINLISMWSNDGKYEKLETVNVAAPPQPENITITPAHSVTEVAEEEKDDEMSADESD